MPSKLLKDKAKYVIEKTAAEVPVWLKPFLRFDFIKGLWQRWCFWKVSRLSEGEVLYRYYELIGRVTNE